MAPDSGDDDVSAVRERVRELEQTVADLKTERQRPTVGRRGVLGALAGAAGLGAVGVYGSSQPAAAQASGQVGTASGPVDVFGYNVQAENGVETPSLTDTDTGTTYDIGTFTEGEVLSDQDGDGVYTLPSGSVGIDVGSVSTDRTITAGSYSWENLGVIIDGGSEDISLTEYDVVRIEAEETGASVNSIVTVTVNDDTSAIYDQLNRDGTSFTQVTGQSEWTLMETDFYGRGTWTFKDASRVIFFGDSRVSGGIEGIQGEAAVGFDSTQVSATGNTDVRVWGRVE